MKKILLLMGILLAIIVVIYLQFYLNKQRALTTSTKAQSSCDTNCLQPDPCCQKMVDQQDYSACKWPTPRGYCPLSFCNKLPPGLEGRGRCGWYWSFHDANANQYHIGTNTPQGYGCMIGPDENHMTPICGGPNPTNTPIPIYPSPTTQPRRTPTPSSTIEPSPTSAPFNYPTQIPTGILPTSFSPTTILPFFPTQGVRPNISNAPFGNFPSIVPNLTSVVSTFNTLVQQPLDLIEFLFERVIYYDRLLENAINTKLRRSP